MERLLVPVLAALAALTAGTGIGFASGEAQVRTVTKVETVTEEVPVEKLVEKPVVPSSCLDALQEADDLILLAKKTTESYARLSANAADAMGASMDQDLVALTGVLADLEDIQADYKRDLAPLEATMDAYGAAKAACASY